MCPNFHYPKLKTLVVLNSLFCKYHIFLFSAGFFIVIDRYRLLLLGSDCTSSFYRKGKAKAWKTLKSHSKFAETFSSLGANFPPCDKLVIALNEFTCLWYGDTKSKNADECQYTLFKARKCSDDVLPPTCDGLLKHIERANYQTAVWSRCLTAHMNVPSPIGNGWKLADGEIEIEWMTRPPAPESLLEYTDCKCKTGCLTNRCSCKKASLKCTELCSCAGCNEASDGSDEDEEEQSDKESDSEVSDEDFEDLNNF